MQGGTDPPDQPWTWLNGKHQDEYIKSQGYYLPLVTVLFQISFDLIPDPLITAAQPV